MIDPDIVTAAIRDKLRATASVVALVGGDIDRIESYSDDENGIVQAVAEMRSKGILVAWIGNEDISADNIGVWIHRYGVFFRGLGVPFGAVMATICNGVAAGDQLRFTETEIHQDFEQLGVPQFIRESDEDGIEYPRIEVRMRQRSNV